MKYTSSCALLCTLPMLLSSLTTGSLKANDVDPTGSITTDQHLVLANSVVNVKWNAKYPAPPVTRPPQPDAGLVPAKKVRADVRVLSAAYGPVARPQPVRGWVKTSVGTTSWTQIFLGNNSTYNPQTVVWSKVLAPGERLDFKFQASMDSSYSLTNLSSISDWQPAIDTTSSSPYPWNRHVLKDGELAPNYNPAFDQKDLHTHLAAYFYPGTTKVKLGPLDYIYLTELTPYREGSTSSDMQDLVLLVSFTEIVTP